MSAPSVRQTNTPIITEEAFVEVLNKARDEIEKNPGRSILNVVLAPDNASFNLALDPRPDQPGLIDAALARDRQTPPSAAELAFAAEVKRIWKAYDHEQMVMCLLCVGQSTQITCRPKPWILKEELHEHCSCGFRRGVDADHDKSHYEAAIIGNAAEKLLRLFKDHKVSESHGIDHARRVLSHTRNAMSQAKPEPTETVRLAMMLAALLHDADDHKFFKESDDPLQNARTILLEVLQEHPEAQKVKDIALEAITLVSASNNGNSVPQSVSKNPFLLYPRLADRLEAIGEIGIVRCHQYTLEVGRPLYTDTTPTPSGFKQVFEIATPARFESYLLRKKSESMVDHIFDKLLNIIDPLISHENVYFSSIAKIRIQPLIEVCTASRPKAFNARLEIAKARVEAGCV